MEICEKILDGIADSIYNTSYKIPNGKKSRQWSQTLRCLLFCYAENSKLVFYNFERRIIMRLNPKEQEKLLLHMAGNLAKERKERGLKLNYVEALAYNPVYFCWKSYPAAEMPMKNALHIGVSRQR